MGAVSFPVRGTTRAATVWGRILGRGSLVRRLDWMLFGAAFALSVIGALLVFSATRGRMQLNQGDPYFFVVRHLINTGIGLALGALTLWYGHRRLRDTAAVLYVVTVLLVTLVLTPVGATINGSRRWIVIGGGMSIQPAEFVKVAIIIAMAVALTARVDAGDLIEPDRRGIVRALTLGGVPALLVLLTPDLGQALGIAAIVLCMLVAAGAPKRWVLGLLGIGVAGCLAVWQFHLLDQYQINRFAAFADPALDPSGVGYNTSQARIAIGAGGLTGSGLFHGAQTNGQFVPEQQTDFVFSVAGEELGFLGAGLIIVLIGVVLWRACRIARHCPDLYGTVTAAGIVGWLAFQAFENIGMNLGIMPVTGLPLPFVSYGGSSMFAGWVAVGLLQSIKVQRTMSA
ncbi:rod shape-determining protein RodA [Streptomyces noursei]|uniref:peptidoglycan glycosyltransferase n=2 Tax=Streptomyces TaxID=1883 RepID=A0A2N8PIX0_STRNR|nr:MULTISPECIES: rod shape-determining protein RodA [Streptomyces]PNE40983.1 rod shape-determining protein RodA [Streptomyces noursei]SHN10003.1 rod shape determining protein RodA [Streptomyces yunnanensis]